MALFIEKINWTIFEKIGNDSFDLYLYSDSINYVFLFVAANYFPELYSTGIGNLAAFLMRFVITFLGAIIVGKIVKVIKKWIWRKT